MNQRLKTLRKTLKLTQQKFASGIGLTQNYWALVEAGTRVPSDRSISDICRVYNVNEIWLREGIGEMFLQLTRQQEILTIFSRLSSYPAGSPQEILLHALAVYLDKLDESDWNKVDAFLDDLIAGRENKKTGD